TPYQARLFPVAGLFVATQYEIPFKLSISAFHVSVMAITRDSEPQSSPSFVVFKLVGVHWLPFLKNSLPCSSHCGERQGVAKATEPMAERTRANVVPTLNKASGSYAQVCMRKLAMCFVAAIA